MLTSDAEIRPAVRWLPGPQGLVVAGAAVAAARLGLRSIGDNSTLVHLRTGIEILHTGHVPHSDPYSFTAAGHSWVVQSWLASVVYALANNIGHHALVFEQGLIMAAVGAVIALAARSITAWRSTAAAVLAIGASAPGWSPRPLMFGLLCLGLTVVIVERRWSPWWLIPVVWIWANTHGSFPLGLAWLGAYAVGQAVDVKGWPRHALRYMGAFVVALGAALLNPVGPRLLTFPLVALNKKSTFQGIVEWRSPNFQDPNTFVALVFIALSLVVLLRAALPWSQLLPVCVFLVAGLVAERNLGPLGVVMAPPLAIALASPKEVWRGWADVRADLTRFGRSVGSRAGAFCACALAALGLALYAARGETLRLSSFPVAAADHLQAIGRLDPTHRIAAVDVVGCFLIWRNAPNIRVFIDDRYDMYPHAVATDAGILAAGGAGAAGVLDKWRVDTVLWSTAQPLPATLEQSGGWHVDWRDARWVVLLAAPRDPATTPRPRLTERAGRSLPRSARRGRG